VSMATSGEGDEASRRCMMRLDTKLWASLVTWAIETWSESRSANSLAQESETAW
jgi:hypothetical protein